MQNDELLYAIAPLQKLKTLERLLQKSNQLLR